MIDAHTHLNIDIQDAIREYAYILKKSNIDASVLILNGSEHMDVFWKDADCFFKLCSNTHLAFLLDIKNPQYFEESVKLADKYGIGYSIKLHPRLTGISEKDFKSIEKYISRYDFRSIIVDSFLYGSTKENICYIELSTYLAKHFCDKNVVMAHFGGIKALECMLRTRELKNIFYDCSFSINYLKGTSVWMDLRHCILYSADRVMFGSDMPSFTTEDSKNTVLELLGNQTESLYDNIFSNNARRVYFE